MPRYKTYPIPTVITNGIELHHPQLVVQASLQGHGNAGRGVFALEKIRAGGTLPIVGTLITPEEEDLLLYSGRGTHLVTTTLGTIDGNPTINPYLGVGHHGAALWALINEPTTRKPNCIFQNMSVVVAETISPGAELTISYGSQDDYHRTYPVSRYCFTKQHYRFLDK